MNVVYSLWYDERTDSWEIIRADEGHAVVVQRNIKGRAKAVAARDLWRQREAAR